MKILALHNYYQQRGGEDQCFEDTIRVLKAHGHEVREQTMHNDQIKGAKKVKVALDTLWSRTSYRLIGQVIQDFKPDLMHAMNTFPLFSPSVFYAAKKLGVPVIHEIQNYRTSCAGAYLLRDGNVCEKCIGAAFPIAAIQHRCYRGSRLGSAILATTIALHRWKRTWHNAVDLILCPSKISKQKLIESGMPGEKITVKLNSLDFDPGMGRGTGGFAVFVGRLSPEKGLDTLVDAWKTDSALPILKIIGDGPLATMVQAAQAADTRIQWLGRKPIPELLEIVGQANCLVMPSVWYETFGRTTVEAFAKGTPVVGSRIGGTAEIIDEGKNGWLFTPGNAQELASKVKMAMNLSLVEASSYRDAARKSYLQNYTSEVNYRRLVECYQKAMANSARSETASNA